MPKTFSKLYCLTLLFSFYSCSGNEITNTLDSNIQEKSIKKYDVNNISLIVKYEKFSPQEQIKYNEEWIIDEKDKICEKIKPGYPLVIEKSSDKVFSKIGKKQKELITKITDSFKKRKKTIESNSKKSLYCKNADSTNKKLVIVEEFNKKLYLNLNKNDCKNSNFEIKDVPFFSNIIKGLVQFKDNKNNRSYVEIGWFDEKIEYYENSMEKHCTKAFFDYPPVLKKTVNPSKNIIENKYKLQPYFQSFKNKENIIYEEKYDKLNSENKICEKLDSHLISALNEIEFIKNVHLNKQNNFMTVIDPIFSEKIKKTIKSSDNALSCKTINNTDNTVKVSFDFNNKTNTKKVCEDINNIFSKGSSENNKLIKSIKKLIKKNNKVAVNKEIVNSITLKPDTNYSFKWKDNKCVYKK